MNEVVAKYKLGDTALIKEDDAVYKTGIIKKVLMVHEAVDDGYTKGIKYVVESQQDDETVLILVDEDDIKVVASR